VNCRAAERADGNRGSSNRRDCPYCRLSAEVKRVGLGQRESQPNVEVGLLSPENDIQTEKGLIVALRRACLF
jgi:hypothetical protein